MAVKKSKKFLMRTKPVRPVRRDLIRRQLIDGGMTLQDLVEWAEDQGCSNLNEIKIEATHTYDDSTYFLTYKTEESLESFQERLQEYESKMKEWNEWYLANKDLVDAEMEKRDLKEKIIKEMQILEKKLKELS